MKRLRLFCPALVLSLTLAGSALAGDMSFPVKKQPSALVTSASSDADTSVDGEATREATDEAPADDSIIKAALSLLESLFALF